MLRCLGHSLEIKDEAHKSESNCIDLYNELNTTLIYIYITNICNNIYALCMVGFSFIISLAVFQNLCIIH